MPEWIAARPRASGRTLEERYAAAEALTFGEATRVRPSFDALAAGAGRALARRTDPALVRALAAFHERAGAGQRSHAHLDDLAAGRLVLVFTGQQPAAGGGPLYTIHKAATAVALAARLRDAGVPAAAAFWLAADDSDLAEARTAFAPAKDRSLAQQSIDVRVPEGTLTGDLPRAANDAAVAALFPELPSLHRAVAAEPPQGDLGGYLAALLLALFRDDGLLCVDARLPEVAVASRPFVETYLRAHAGIARDVDAAGAAFEAAGLSRPLHPASTASGLFAITADRRRRKLEPGEAPGTNERASAGVLLRSFQQEWLFPSAAIVAGGGELAYFFQTEPASRHLGVVRSPYVPRLAATWVDETIAALAASGDGPRAWQELFDDPTVAVSRFLRSLLPSEERGALEEGKARLEHVLEPFVSSSDRSVAQIAESALTKMHAQLGRVEEHVLTRARRQAQAKGLALANVAEFLRPRKLPQDRTYSLLWPSVFHGVTSMRDVLAGAASEHLDRFWDGRLDHALLPLGREPARASKEEPTWTASYE